MPGIILYGDIMLTQRKAASTIIRIRPETRRKLNQVAAKNRWTIAETVDAMADLFIRTKAAR